MSSATIGIANAITYVLLGQLVAIAVIDRSLWLIWRNAIFAEWPESVGVVADGSWGVVGVGVRSGVAY